MNQHKLLMLIADGWQRNPILQQWEKPYHDPIPYNLYRECSIRDLGGHMMLRNYDAKWRAMCDVLQATGCAVGPTSWGAFRP